MFVLRDADADARTRVVVGLLVVVVVVVEVGDIFRREKVKGRFRVFIIGPLLEGIDCRKSED